MLNVSNGWKQMFSKNLLNEALIRFDIENYGSLYKTDIFSYTYKGTNHFLCDEYPQCNAVIKAEMRSDYYNFANFIGKKVDIYYGFVINGNEEYVKAISLYIEEISISDDGRVATFQLKSRFANLTDTFSILLYSSYKDGTIAFNNSFTDFLYSVITQYNKVGGMNKNIRFLPSKISKGNALQELAFINGCYIRLQNDNTFYISDKILSTNIYTIDKINILKYPHYEKMEYPKNVSVGWLDFSDEDLDLQISSVGYETITPSYQPITQQWQGYSKKTIDNESIFLLWETMKISTTNNITLPRGSITMANDYYEISFVASTGGGFVDFNIGGYQFNNYYSVVNNEVSIFNINIIDQAQADTIKSRVAKYLSSQKYVELELRIDPSIELLDQVHYEGNAKNLIVEELNINFNGGYSGSVKGRYDDLIIKPDVAIDHYSDHDFTFYVQNSNPFAVELHIEYSGGTLNMSLQPNELLELNDSNCPELLGSFQAKAYQDLAEEVYCWFEDPETGEPSDNTIILEAD